MLFRITNAQNVTVIVEKMLDFLRVSTDDYTTIDLVGKVAELAEKYPSIYVDHTMSRSSVGGKLWKTIIKMSRSQIIEL